jgi:hypothetical protein
MKYNVTTKQGNNYIVSDDSAWLWIELERELGYTVSQAADKMSQGSLDVITCMLYKAAKPKAIPSYQVSKPGLLMSLRPLRWSRKAQKRIKGCASEDRSI